MAVPKYGASHCTSTVETPFATISESALDNPLSSFFVLKRLHNNTLNNRSDVVHLSIMTKRDHSAPIHEGVMEGEMGGLGSTTSLVLLVPLSRSGWNTISHHWNSSEEGLVYLFPVLDAIMHP
jgi:hypothetical protein